MKSRPLGSTGLHVSELALGSLYTSSLGGGVEESRRILTAAREAGINYIDTAPAYGDSEATLGEAWDGQQDAFVLSTKLGGRPQPFDPQDAAALRGSVEESLRLLKRETIDILMIHEPDRPLQYPWWTSYEPYAGPVLEVIDALKSEGKIKHTGLGGTTVSEMTHLIRSGLFDVVLTAFNFNILFREAAAELIPEARSRGMGIVIGSVLGQGGLGRRYDDAVRERPNWMSHDRQQQLLRLYALLDQLDGMPLAELGVRWALSQEEPSSILIGPKTVEQLESSVVAAERGSLPEDVLRELDEIAAMLPNRPFEEPMILPLGKDYRGPAMANVGAAVKVGKL
ncbi:aldo/keto reductase [Haloferula helveola]